MLKNKSPGRPIGAEQRLCWLTYSQIAGWVGLKPRTVREYASRSQFDQTSVESVLQWVNARRQKRGLPLIGQPPPPTEG